MMSMNPLQTHKANLLGARSLHSGSDEDVSCAAANSMTAMHEVRLQTLNWSLLLHNNRTSNMQETVKT